MKLIRVLIGVLISISIWSQAAKTQDYEAAPLFTYQDLKRLIQDNHITSVDQLTSFLPDELQRNITFRLKPHNRLQEGVRAIRFTEDGRLILTHNDNASFRGGNSIEIMEKTQDGQTLMHEIDFAKDQKKPPKFVESHTGAKQNQTCTACHGEPPRKIFASYNVWPDYCGEHDDKADEKCLKFLNSAKTNPRFKDLRWDPKNLAWPYYNKASDRGYKNAPNTRLGLVVLVDNAIQMSKTVEQSNLYKKLKYTLFNQDFCDPLNPSASSSDRERIQSILSRSPEVVKPSNFKGNQADYVDELLNHNAQYTEADQRSAVFKPSSKLFEFFGLPMGNTGGVERLERNAMTEEALEGITASSDNYLTAALLIDEGKNDKTIAEAVKQSKLKKSDYSSSEYEKISPKLQAEYNNIFLGNSIYLLCPYFKEQSKKELDALENENKKACVDSVFHKTSDDIKSNFENLNKPIDDLVKEQGKEILKKANCITCHDPSKAEAVGPLLHFSNPKKFAKDDDKYSKLGMSLVDEAELMMSDKTPAAERMPLNSPNLTEDEQKAVIKYLRSISE